ncbi:MAG: hypothetical protein Ct9H300mP31_13970 [Acidimicrobiaceae bacterium]|nr:MAG: hypothetical protein Ct9H300mP31_13970 [Acidimicrobiaceae bacterium]
MAAELDGTGLRDEVDAAYRRFLDVNQAFLSLCTDWQMCPNPEDPGAEPVVNDHTDLVYDGMVIDRLGETDAAVSRCVRRWPGSWAASGTTATG